MLMLCKYLSFCLLSLIFIFCFFSPINVFVCNLTCRLWKLLKVGCQWQTLRVQTYNGGPGAEPPARYRGRPHCQGLRKAENVWF